MHGRRKFFISSVFGTLGLAIPRLGAAQSSNLSDKPTEGELFYRYPAIGDELVAEVVAASHTRFDDVKKLVTARPELAKASWDWGFGDYETAIGAASHMGRADIAAFLMEHGARPTIFTYAMLGAVDVVKGAIDATPGVQSVPGPHGITLLQHAQIRLRRSDLSDEDMAKMKAMVEYLGSVEGSDDRATSLEISEEDKAQYFGEYQFGEKEDEVFEVNLNSRKFLQIARKGNFGRVLNRVGEHQFAPGGGPSVRIHFTLENGEATSLTVHEPEPIVKAVRI